MFVGCSDVIPIRNQISLSWQQDIQDLNAKKSCETSDSPTKIIKLNSDIFSNLIYKHFNNCIDEGEFPNDLKHADIVPI